MKSIKELEVNIRNPELFNSQFEEYSDTNILWIAPQMTGRQLYKTILPSWYMECDELFTAITGLEKYDPTAQLIDVHVELNTQQLLWADIVVFPFTTQPLQELYNQIRMVNEKIKIYYTVDFNFYLMSKEHPYHSIFSPKQTQQDIEDNMYYSDLVITSNIILQQILRDKLRDLSLTRYKDVFNSPVKVCAVPFLTHEETLTENLEYEPKEKIKKNGKFRLGIVATNVYFEDIMAFNPVFREINKKFKNKVQLVFYGFDGKHKGKNALDGVDFEFHKPTSIIQYFKELNSLNLDLLLIPIKASDYNQSSENYNKWLEASLLGIPVLTNGNVYPYSRLIQNEKNGLVYKEKKDIIKILSNVIGNKNKLIGISDNANKDVKENFSFSDPNIETLRKNYLI